MQLLMQDLAGVHNEEDAFWVVFYLLASTVAASQLHGPQRDPDLSLLSSLVLPMSGWASTWSSSFIQPTKCAKKCTVFAKLTNRMCEDMHQGSSLSRHTAGQIVFPLVVLKQRPKALPLQKGSGIFIQLKMPQYFMLY